ncbi:hypothetical protein [Nocardia terpenica]|uniref:hypothetical protein n=1 Tax=Nocardia terpenica TaxID=455432 RepID=UPI00082B7DD9|nr:hypothetical protein [Nocardia terpenica]NQE91097.1 hypothetical protein [Nocardia terpenica]
MTIALLAVDAWTGVRTQIPLPSPCDLLNPALDVCKHIEDFTKGAAGDAAGSVLRDLVDTLLRGITSLIRMGLTWWVRLPSPQLASATGEPGPILASVRSYTSGLQVVLMIAGILFAAARLAVAKRGAVAGEAQESFLIFSRAVMASMLLGAVITTGTKCGDAFSTWVIDHGAGADVRGVTDRLFDVAVLTAGGLGTGVMLVLGFLGTISALIQLVMLVVREAFLILVVAALPLSAAAAGTGPGSQAYQRMLQWALALVLWKPVGALVYAIAFSAAGVNGAGRPQDPQLLLLGMILLLSVPIVLPALMRLIAPAVAALGGGGGGAAVLAGGALGVGLGVGGRGKGFSGARKVTEGSEATGGGPTSPSAGGGGSAPTPPGGGGVRPSGGGGGGGNPPAPTGQGSGASNRPSRNGAASSGSTGGNRASGKAAAGGGAAGAAGVAGVAMAAGQAAQHGVQALNSSVEGPAPEPGTSVPDPSRPGPMEVRR